MARERNPNRDKAYQIWLEHNGKITNRAIAEMLGEKEKTISVWKLRDKWNVVLQKDECSTTNEAKPKRGAPRGNKNALGNDGGAPLRNDNAVIHGFFRKYFPEDAVEIMQEIETRSPIDILWENIVIQYTAIVRAQRIMYVRDKDDLTQVLKRQKESSGIGSESWEKEYELQFAWDKHANFLQAQSRAMTTLNQMIARYEELCRSDLATEEQRLRIEKLKAEVKALDSGDEDKDLTIIVDYGDSNGDG